MKEKEQGYSTTAVDVPRDSAGKFMAKCRAKTGISQLGLAAKVRAAFPDVQGLSSGHIGFVECDKRSIPEEMIGFLGELFGVSAKEFEERDQRTAREAVRHLLETKPEMVGVLVAFARALSTKEVTPYDIAISRKPGSMVFEILMDVDIEET